MKASPKARAQYGSADAESSAINRGLMGLRVYGKGLMVQDAPGLWGLFLGLRSKAETSEWRVQG